MCHEEGIRVTSLPGPAALIVALTLSGLPTRRFAFEAFLPSEKKDRKMILEELKTETRTIIIYEAPHHLKGTLKELRETLGDRRITICRELTKKFETVMPTTLDKAIGFYESEEPRGEYVLVIEGVSFKELELKKQEGFESMSIEEHMKLYMDKGTDKKDAMKLVAADRGISKRDVYSYLLEHACN